MNTYETKFIIYSLQEHIAKCIHKLPKKKNKKNINDRYIRFDSIFDSSKDELSLFFGPVRPLPTAFVCR